MAEFVETEFDFEEDDEIDLSSKLLTENLSSETLALLKVHLGSNLESNLLELARPLNFGEDAVQTEQNSLETLDNNEKYAKQDYWEQRFQEEDEYDWLLTFNDLKDIILPHLNQTDRILIVGCGNSPFSSELYQHGFVNITNIDYSHKVIERMQKKYLETCPLMEWIYMDMTDLEFNEDSFDVVIDKASMDALLCEEGDVWNPDENVIQMIDKMCLSISKVLKKSTGKFLQITFAQPHFRTKYLMGTRLPLPPSTSTEPSPFSTVVGVCSRYSWTLLPPEPVETKHEGLFRSFLYLMQRHEE